MADRLPDFAAASRVWQRGWHEYENYKVVHENHVDALISEGVVIRDTLRFLETVADNGDIVQVNLRGRLHTQNGAIVVVNKWLGTRIGIRNRLEVLTHEYMYHAFVRDPDRQDLFRYDSCHGIDSLHCHRFDSEGAPEQEVAPIDLGRMPPLDLIIREADNLARWLHHHRGE